MQALSLAAFGAGLAALIAATLARRGQSALPILAFLRTCFEQRATTSRWLAIAASAGLASVVLPLAVAVLTSNARWTFEPLARSAGGAVLLTLTVKLAFVVFEEVTFRGALMEIVAARAGQATAVTASALAFAAAHLGRTDAAGNPGAVAVWMLDGLAYGAAAAATGSLRTPVVWHFARNAAIWLVFGQSTMQLAPGIGRVEYITPGPLWGSTTTTGASDVVAAAACAAMAVALAVADRQRGASVPGTASTGAGETQSRR